MALCSRCGRATCHAGQECALCRHEGEINTAEAVGVVVPYSFKLLLQIGARHATKKKNHGSCAASRDHSHGHRLAASDRVDQFWSTFFPSFAPNGLRRTSRVGKRQLNAH